MSLTVAAVLCVWPSQALAADPADECATLPGETLRFPGDGSDGTDPNMRPVKTVWCPSFVDSYTYYNGCGTKTYSGDSWDDCNGYSGGSGSPGHWRERLRSTCGSHYPYINCFEDINTYTYWENCSGTWVQRTETQFNNGDCQC